MKVYNKPPKRIDLNAIVEFARDTDTKRINFHYFHVNALSAITNESPGWINLPFNEPFESFAEEELNLDKVLFPPRRNIKTYWRRIDDTVSYEKILSMIDKYKDLVFLRDCLDLSLALTMHEYYDGNDNLRTVLGQCEYNLKYQSDNKDTTEDMNIIRKEVQKWLEQLPYYRNADYICAVPSRKNFVREIIKKLNGFIFKDISEFVSWSNKTGDIKNTTTYNEKLKMLQEWEFLINPELDLKDKTVILVDDMYKSGITMQFIAMKLKERGAKYVFGMCICKALSNN